ncbi:MAG: SDR family NAD(P)-dependent oxidoreductase [Acidimicrobiales bacterium]
MNDEASMVAAVEQVESDEGAVGVLVNNAGFSLTGPIEAVPMDEVRRQFDTNVFGLVRMCQLVLPQMRAHGWGRIINISSMGGKLTFPGMGFYHGTKYAVEAISDALRFEVRPFGVKVVLVDGADQRRSATRPPDTSTRRRPPTARTPVSSTASPRRSLTPTRPMGVLAVGPDAVAKVIERAATTDRPRSVRRRPPAPSAARHQGAAARRRWDLAMRGPVPQPGR